MMRLKDKKAIIVGASKGVGKVIAQAFARAGAQVIVVARDRARVEETAGLCGATAVVADVADPAAARRVAAHDADILVNSAGFFLWRAFLDLSPDDWDRTLRAQLSATFFMSQAFAARGRPGSIINIGSVHGAVGDANTVAQCAAKAGVLGLTRAMAEALRGHDIRVNLIAPGGITRSAEVSSELGGMVSQGDIAEAAIYFASDVSRAVTGSVLEAYGATRPVIAAP
jgi:NAD(P)-dependent dehydrogenase (short-subunit alcohol dehydrogenase family)